MGRFAISRVCARGEQVGWGIVCGRHLDAADVTTNSVCKKQIVYGAQELPDAECILRLKRWIAHGFHINTDGLYSRREHVGCDARVLLAGSLEELQAEISSFPAD